jgi:hypothetical protein
VDPFQADTRTVLALELVRELPDTLAALTDGVIDWDRAAIIAAETRVLDAATRREVEAKLLAKACGQTVRQLRRRVEAAVLAADPAAAERRREQGRRADGDPAPWISSASMCSPGWAGPG